MNNESGSGPVLTAGPEIKMIVQRRQALNAAGARKHRTILARLDLLQVQAPGLAFVMAGELLQPAAGMLILGGDRGGAALFGLLVEETYVVHAAHKAARRARFRYLSDLAGRFV